MPTKSQYESIAGLNSAGGTDQYVASFKPVVGGRWYNGSNATAQSGHPAGYYYSSERSNNAVNYYIWYYSDTGYMGTNNGGVYRYSGFYIRCASK